MSLSFLFLYNGKNINPSYSIVTEGNFCIFLSFFAQIHIFWCEKMKVNEGEKATRKERKCFFLLFPSHRLFLTLWQWNFRFSLFLHLLSFKRRLFFICSSYGDLSSQCVRCKLLMMIPSAYDNGKNEILFLFMAWDYFLKYNYCCWIINSFFL